MALMVFGVVGVTRTTGTTLEHQIVGWFTVIGSDCLRIYSIYIRRQSLPLALTTANPDIGLAVVRAFSPGYGLCALVVSGLYGVIYTMDMGGYGLMGWEGYPGLGPGPPLGGPI